MGSVQVKTRSGKSLNMKLLLIALSTLSVVTLCSAHCKRYAHATCTITQNDHTNIDAHIKFKQCMEPHAEFVLVEGIVSGLEQGLHGFHIHESGDESINEDCKNAGPHSNPFDKLHGGQSDDIESRHIGDLGNIEANEHGYSRFQMGDTLITLDSFNKRFIGGRGVVVHEKEDDLGKGDNEESHKTGNAGARIGCCTITMEE